MEGSKGEQFREWLESRAISPTTIRNYFFIINLLLNSFQNPTIDDLNLFFSRQTRNKQNATVVRAALIKYLQWTNQENLKTGLIKIKDTRPLNIGRRVHIEDIKKLRDSFKNEWRDIFKIQLYTGCRALEAIWISRKDIEIDDEWARIRVTRKGGRVDFLYCNKEIAEAILNNPLYKNKNRLFLPDNCQHIERDEFLKTHYNAIRMRYLRAWQKACKNSNLPLYASHDARRAVLRFIMANYGVAAAKQIAGHQNANDTMRYAEPVDKNLLRGIEDQLR